MDNQVLLTTSEAARRRGVSEATIRSAARRGDLLPAITTGSGMRLYRPTDVDALRTGRKDRG
jgi:excisionase family DNA binding protein